MTMSKKNTSVDALRMTREIVGCKWSLHVLDAIAAGQRRPGRICAFITGISTKVMNERLKKLQRYELIGRKVYPVSPPKVEYRLTPRGRSFVRALGAIRALCK